MSNERHPIFKILDQITKEELDQHHRELRQLAQATGEQHNQVFEVDGQEHIIPAEAIHDYIQEHRSKHGFPTLRAALNNASKSSERPFAGRIPAMPKRASESDPEGYYWDTNYNYEFMNPESEKQQVLGRVKK